MILQRDEWQDECVLRHRDMDVCRQQLHIRWPMFGTAAAAHRERNQAEQKGGPKARRCERHGGDPLAQMATSVGDARDASVAWV